MVNFDRNREQKSMTLINTLSVVIPVVVAILLGIRQKVDIGAWTKVLPHVIGAINTLTSVLLIYGLILIKQKQIERHRKVMSSAFFLGALFLVCYVLYHLTNPSTKFGGEGFEKYFYYFILISHVGLSFIVLPLVLRAYYFAYTKQFERHKKMTRFAFPIWLYVSITGVIAYLMIKPYYQLSIIN
jgi:putative membrane protein